MKARWSLGLVIAIVTVVLALAVLSRCNQLPPNEGRTHTTALRDPSGTRLAAAVTPLVDEHPGLSGVHPLVEGRDAFAARYRLAAAAARTIDVQYYIWNGDRSGLLLMKALIDAADRGVRVRLLLDDNSMKGLDALLAAVDAHPNVEVRLFNPFVVRRPREIGYLTEFTRLNRRMHNKSFTVDNAVTIIGGRNIGDEYFDARSGLLFADLDAMGIGPVVQDVSRDFDRYWASDLAYPVDRLLRVSDSELRGAATELAGIEADPLAQRYVAAATESFVDDLSGGRLELEWAETRLISDPPAKALDRAHRRELLTAKFAEIFGQPDSGIDLVSPYFVPAVAGTELLTGWAERGVRVRVLTNSLEATDVTVVHSGYVKRREDLLAGGVELFEMRPDGAVPHAENRFGGSGSSLHAKTFAVDRSRIFIGSFNFDPRSADLNTEMGFVIDSPRLAARVSEAFDASVPLRAWQVSRTDAGDLVWKERNENGTIIHRTEPGTSFVDRIVVSFLSLLPLDSLL